MVNALPAFLYTNILGIKINFSLFITLKSITILLNFFILAIAVFASYPANNLRLIPAY